MLALGQLAPGRPLHSQPPYPTKCKAMISPKKTNKQTKKSKAHGSYDSKFPLPPLCLAIKATPGPVLASRASPCIGPGKVTLGDSLSSRPAAREPRPPTSTVLHTTDRGQERNLLELLCPGELLAPRRQRPSLSHAFLFFLCKAIGSVEDPKVAPTCLAPG